MRFTGTFVVVAALFVTVLATSNIISMKPVNILPIPWFGNPGMIVPASFFIFPVSYILGDVLTEVYGYRVARGVIWLGFVANLLVVLSLWLTGIIPGASDWNQESQDSYNLMLAPVSFILLGSFIAHLTGEFINSTVLALIKFWTQGRLLFVRTIGSTVVAQGLNSFIFIYVAFGLGITVLDGNPNNDWTAAALLGTSMAQWVLKILCEVLATPLTYFLVNRMKRQQSIDVIDPPSSLNPLGIFA